MAAGMSLDRPRIPVNRLRTILGEQPSVELTTMVAGEEMRSRTASHAA